MKNLYSDFLKLNRIVVLFIGTGLMILAFEIYFEHYYQLNFNKFTWIPIFFGSISGALCILIALFFNRLGYYLFNFLMAVSIFVGTLGLYFHNKWRFPFVYDFFINHKAFEINVLTDYTPLIAPSAFAAIGSLGILIAYFHRWGDNK